MPVALAPVPSVPPLVVIAHDDPGTADSLRHAVESAVGWQVLMADPSPAGLTAALASGPSVALVGCAALANLPSGCRTPLIAVGDDDRPGDVRAALDADARSLLAWPDGVADLPGELARLAALDQPGAAGGLSGLVVAARGVRGGAGTTTVAVHLAAAWARWGPAPVLLLDLAGGLAFRLDLVAAPTWSTLVPAVGLDPGGPGADAQDMGAPDLGVLEVDTLGAGVVDTADLDSGAPPAGDLDAPMLDGRSLGAGTLMDTLAQPWAGLSVLPLAGPADGAYLQPGGVGISLARLGEAARPDGIASTPRAPSGTRTYPTTTAYGGEVLETVNAGLGCVSCALAAGRANAVHGGGRLVVGPGYGHGRADRLGPGLGRLRPVS